MAVGAVPAGRGGLRLADVRRGVRGGAGVPVGARPGRPGVRRGGAGVVPGGDPGRGPASGGPGTPEADGPEGLCTFTGGCTKTPPTCTKTYPTRPSMTDPPPGARGRVRSAEIREVYGSTHKRYFYSTKLILSLESHFICSSGPLYSNLVVFCGYGGVFLVHGLLRSCRYKLSTRARVGGYL